METKRGNGAVAAGTILVLVGLLALFGQMFNAFNIVWDTFWPFIVVGVGLLFFVGMLAGGKSAASLAIPGCVITAIGLILFIQNTADYWQSWAYAWTVIVIAAGLGIFIRGIYGDDQNSRRAGLRVTSIGLVLLVVFGVFFELVLNFGGLARTDLGRFGLPLLLIGIGAVLIFNRLFIRPAETPSGPERKVSPER